MAFKDILKVFKLERELTDDETALLNTLRGMSESERELLAETLGPVVKSKGKPTAATKRKIDHCEVCNYTRRALLHKDPNVGDYHEFVESSGTKKSARASGIAATLGSRSRKPPQPAMCVACGEGESHSNHDLDNGGHEFEASVSARAVKTLEKYESDDGDTCTFEGCTRPADDNVHHLATHSYYHEFQPATAQSASGG